MSISRLDSRAPSASPVGSASPLGPPSNAASSDAATSLAGRTTRAGGPNSVADAGSPGPTEEPSPFARLLQGLGKEAKAGEKTIRDAVRASAAGKDLGPSELLALQAGVYRYSEVIDLAAKLVDRASNGVKTVISGQ